MKFLLPIEIFCFAVNFQLVESQLRYISNGTIYIKHGDGPETGTTQEQPNHTLSPYQSENTEQNQYKPAKPESTEALGLNDHYTFVAIIEIMFNDGSRKHCTGAIIHDNVVLTAAHCFENQHLNSLEPELTGSFVIIGTKEMYDTGYEQYLPIERVLTHPDYKGWNADLALVYTFAGMMSDKPGNILPLAEENSYTSLYANVTVFNWNHPKKSVKKNIPLLEIGCSQSSENKDDSFENEVTTPKFSSEDWKSKEVIQESTFAIEDYTIFDTVACKRLVKKLLPAINQIENVNKTVCYLTKRPNKVKASSGALAVNQNHLVAIAAGEFDNDSEHIIVATKLSCFCTWVSDNLPGGGEKLLCCKNCCPESSDKIKEEGFLFKQ